MWYGIVKKILFLMEAERSHNLTIKILYVCLITPLAKWLRRHKCHGEPFVFQGLVFPNRVGLAAGLDKNGDAINALLGLGFGFVEVGTVTPKPQEGNPLPRMFRLPASQAFINRMGFNNKGVDYLVERLKERTVPGVVGVNIGKNKTTPLDEAVDDYLFCQRVVYPFADYITINISSPNTPGLRDLQNGHYLENLLAHLVESQRQLQQLHQKKVPLWVKIAPDLSAEALESMLEILGSSGIDGLIVSNTTVARPTSLRGAHRDESGGLSGEPLMESSTNILQTCYQKLGTKLPIVGVGGIMNGDDVAKKLAAGAELVQVYTGFIYHGPGWLWSLIRQAKK